MSETAGGQRAGSRALSLFANPLSAPVLGAHRDGARRLFEVQAAVGPSAESTVRATISTLCSAGALRRRPRAPARGGVTELTAGGRELLRLAAELHAWLARAPAGRIEPGTPAAKEAIKALAGGWSSTAIRGLAAHPMTLGELDDLISGVSLPTLERRLTWMRQSGQIEAAERVGRGTPYVVTDWLRRAIAPLSVSGRIERRHFAADSEPITEVEIEAAFLMSLPLASLPAHASGPCLLAVQKAASLGVPIAARLAGVMVEVDGGAIVSCATDLTTAPTTWAVGSADAWLDAVIDGEIGDLRLNGERPQLALDLVAGLHRELFPKR